MKAEILIVTAASALALTLAFPNALQVALASVTVLAAKRIERRRKPRKQKAPRREPER